MDIERFNRACKDVLESERIKNGIGTLSEKSMHAVLKKYFEPDSERHEISVGGFVADIVGENGIIEIQTRSLYGMNKKLDAFLQCCRVCVVYPIVRTKRIIWIDDKNSEVRISRTGMRKKTLLDALPEIYYLRKYISNPNFSICLLLLEADDYRVRKTKSKSRKSCICDRFPTAILDETVLAKPSDYMQFLPNNLPREFISADVKEFGNMSLPSAQSLLYFLNENGLVKRIGKRGNSYIYEVV